MEIEVAVPSPIPSTFTYSADMAIQPGRRVVVPFGRQKLVGVTVANRPESEKHHESRLLKPILEVLDDEPIFSETMLKLARWMSDYYLHPIGEVLRTMLPGGTVKSKKTIVSYKSSPDEVVSLLADPLRAYVSRLFGKKSQLGLPTLLKKIKAASKDELDALGFEDPSTLFETFLSRGLLSVEEKKDVRARSITTAASNFQAPEDTSFKSSDPDRILTECQRRAMSAIESAIVSCTADSKSSKPILLFGITGSGKTELYLQTIAKLAHLKNTSGFPPQTLMLVPEISLTPQMTRVFDARFPDQVAVVHSAMSNEERWEQLQRIRDGHASILIGPRSAVFAPFANLKLVIVDEEHDASYKQASGLHYNGRDVAIVRSQLESCVTLLGSATPSLESFYNGLCGKYEVIELVERASRRSLPSIDCVDSKPSFSKGAIVPKLDQNGTYHSSYWPSEIESVPVPIDPTIIEELRTNFQSGMQSIVLVNRRGYAFFLFSPTTRQTIRCPVCAISLTLHKKSASLHCHYCDFKEPIAAALTRYPGEQFVAIGYGSEKTEESLRNLIPGARIERLDSDIASDRGVLSEVLERFRKREIDILVGTQMLAKGHDFPGVTLVAVLDVDQSLNLPDFRAGERAFQLIVQSAGRAGRGEHPGKVLLQCTRGSHPVIASASAQDYRTFASYELGFRQAHGYPPFSRLIAIEFNSEDKQEIERLKTKLEAWGQHLISSRPDLVGKVRLLGPSAPPLDQVRGRHRMHMILSGADRGPLWHVAKALCEDFRKLPAKILMLVDVDPQSLL